MRGNEFKNFALNDLEMALLAEIKGNLSLVGQVGYWLKAETVRCGPHYRPWQNRDPIAGAHHCQQRRCVGYQKMNRIQPLPKSGRFYLIAQSIAQKRGVQHIVDFDIDATSGERMVRRTNKAELILE